MTQPSLFNPGPADSGLSERLELALHYLKQHPEGVKAIIVGCAVHETRGQHPAGPCKWGRHDGQAMLRSLQARGLAARDKHGMWRPTTTTDTGYDPATSPFPEGF